MAQDKDQSEQKQPIAPGQHRATYARDKRNGGYIIRVVGPYATRFAGRTVPVHRADGTSGQEELDTLVWSGVDDGTFNAADRGQIIALYTFEAAPREDLDDSIPF